MGKGAVGKGATAEPKGKRRRQEKRVRDESPEQVEQAATHTLEDEEVAAAASTSGEDDAASGGPRCDQPSVEHLEPLNEVRLVGRLAAPAEERTLPSGDVCMTWRLVVPRAADARRTEGVRAVTVDTIDCTAWTAPQREAARLLVAGQHVALQGALRRRFWRGAHGPASRYEVEVFLLRSLPPASSAGVTGPAALAAPAPSAASG